MSLDYDRGGTPLNRPYIPPPQPGPYQPMLPNSPLLPTLAYPAPIMLPGDPGYGEAPATGYTPTAAAPQPMAAPPPAGPRFPGVDFGQGPAAAAPPPRNVVQAQEETVEPYESMVQEYLMSLRSPAQPPAPRGLSHAQAMAVVMNPEKSRELMAYFDEPYRHEVRSYELNEQRRLRGAEGMMRLADRREARRDRLSSQRYMRDQVNANAGNVGHDYSANPELAGLAASRRGDFNAIHRSTAARDAETLRKERIQEMRRIEDDYRQARGQLVYMHQMLSQAPMSEAQIRPHIEKAEQELAQLETYKGLLSRFSDEDYASYMRLSDEERALFLRALAQRGVSTQARHFNP